MRLSEKIFLWSTFLAIQILVAVFAVTFLQKQGFLNYTKRDESEVVWQTETTVRGQDIAMEETSAEEQHTSERETKEQSTAEETEEQSTQESGTVPAVVLDVPEETETLEEDPYPYYIKVNKRQNCVTIYEKDEAGEYTVPIKAMICSTGNATPKGVFGSKGKYIMKGLIHGVFGQYSTWITGNILFHSVPSARATKDSVSVRNYNQLGTTASAGCIRLTVADAKWIYDNCELGTLIEIYEADEPGPLGKPEAIKLPEGSRWDPTDPDPENPWHEHKPSIEAQAEYILHYGQEWTPRNDIRALDTCGNDVTEKVEVIGQVDCYKPGRYEVSFRLTDAVGKTAQAQCEYLVIPVAAPKGDETEH